MKGILGYILIAASAMLTTIACNKSLSDKQPKHGLILLNAVEEGALNKGTFSATKALLDGNTFMTEGNQIVVYDYYTAPEGVQNPNPATGYYIPGVTAQSTGATDAGTVWPFLGDARYEWTDAGTHKFFGWMVKDNNGTGITANDFFDDDKTDDKSFGFNTTTHTLTIPTTTLSQTPDQFDFMYSNIEPRDLNVQNPDFSSVKLGFKHLFTAFRVTAANNSSNKVWLKSVQITGLKNNRSAQISYDVDGTAPVISYPVSEATEGNQFAYSFVDAVLLSKTPIAVSPQDEFILMWPHSSDDFENAEILVEYNYQDPNGTMHTDCSTTIKLLGSNPWEPGKAYVVGLMFSDKTITLNCTVEPWNKKTETIDFTTQISVSKPIEWVSGVLDVEEDKGEVFFVSDTTVYATCEFQIDTPRGATWTASLIPLEGSTDAFIIQDGYKYGNVGVLSEIKIRVAYSKPIQSRNVALLRITVQTADERTIIANIMPGNDPEITEYKIIQNLING